MHAEDSFPVELVPWREAVRLSRLLAKKIRGSFSPDIVVAIGRGGYVPARIVCDSLMLSSLTSIRVEHWGVAAKSRESAVVRYPLATDVRGMDVLVVDDVTDTGETLEVAVRYLNGLSPKAVRTAVLHHKAKSAFTPDYYALYEESWRWIVYPWALHEDLTGFCESVMGRDPLAPAEILAALRDRYGMAPSRRAVGDALGELVRRGRAEREGGKYRRARGNP
ncbi:MAG: phosphoribosyltransferase [Methanolinea sp.]|nr:phosphoribosyltransferase [Methanolinea sp.]